MVAPIVAAFWLIVRKIAVELFKRYGKKIAIGLFKKAVSNYFKNTKMSWNGKFDKELESFQKLGKDELEKLFDKFTKDVETPRIAPNAKKGNVKRYNVKGYDIKDEAYTIHEAKQIQQRGVPFGTLLRRPQL